MSIGDEGDPRAYIRLAAELRRAIADGTYPPGTPTPSITTLSQRYGHARQTCAKALRVLVDEGLLIRYPGLGYYVAGAAKPDNPASGAGKTDAPQRALARFSRGVSSRPPVPGAGKPRAAASEQTGIDAIRLTARHFRPASTTLWVDPRSYLPIELVTHPDKADEERTEFRWLPPTRANLALLSPPIPAGFRELSG